MTLAVAHHREVLHGERAARRLGAFVLFAREAASLPSTRINQKWQRLHIWHLAQGTECPSWTYGGDKLKLTRTACLAGVAMEIFSLQG